MGCGVLFHDNFPVAHDVDALVKSVSGCGAFPDELSADGVDVGGSLSVSGYAADACISRFLRKSESK